MMRSLRSVGAILAAVIAVATAADAQPDFASSRAEAVPAHPVAGDVVRHVLSVVNAGAPAPFAEVTASTRGGFLIGTEDDCSGGERRDDGVLVWHSGPFEAGAARRCTLVLLTRRDAAGIRTTAVAEIRVPPASYLRIDSAAELATPADPHAVALGPIAVSRAGFVVLALLALLVAGLPLILRRPHAASNPKSATGLLRNRLGAWIAVVAAIGFLVLFVALAHEDWRSFMSYRQTLCTVLGSELDTHESLARTGDPRASYTPLFALRYSVDAAAMVSTGYATASALAFNQRSGPDSVFTQFATGSEYPCWYDPQDPRTVVLVRGPGGAYLFALLPLPVLAIGLALLRAGRRRDGASSNA